jgi:hypothetical protein
MQGRFPHGKTESLKIALYAIQKLELNKATQKLKARIAGKVVCHLVTLLT